MASLASFPSERSTRRQRKPPDPANFTSMKEVEDLVRKQARTSQPATISQLDEAVRSVRVLELQRRIEHLEKGKTVVQDDTDASDCDSDYPHFISMISRKHKDWVIPVTIQIEEAQIPIHAFIDSGADFNCIKPHLVPIHKRVPYGRNGVAVDGSMSQNKSGM